MSRLSFALKRAALIGAVAAAVALSATSPAAAQYVRCPSGYIYSGVYGCVPISPAYGDIYGDPDSDYDVGPPAYDEFGYGYGYGGGFGGRGRGGNRGGGGSHGGGNPGGGNTGGGGAHGGGSHGGHH
jgi:hypothetical protein